MWYNSIRSARNCNIKMYIVASQRGISPSVNIPHLAFTSELDTLRWDMRSGFNERSSLSLFSEGSAYMMQTIASYMQRYRSGHNGADSKSVCAKSTRGFESLPLRQKIDKFRQKLVDFYFFALRFLIFCFI